MDCSGFPNRLLNFYDFQLFVISEEDFENDFIALAERYFWLMKYITAEYKTQKLFIHHENVHEFSMTLYILLISITFPGLEITFFSLSLHYQVFHDCGYL